MQVDPQRFGYRFTLCDQRVEQRASGSETRRRAVVQERQRANRIRRSVEDQFGPLCAPSVLQRNHAQARAIKQFGKLLENFLNNPNQMPNGEVETFAKQYIIYTPYMSGFIQNKYQNSTLGNRQKYGKLIYTYDGTLRIVARYDDAGSGRGPNHVLYAGPLL